MWMDLLQLGVSLNKTKVMNARKGLIRKVTRLEGRYQRMWAESSQSTLYICMKLSKKFNQFEKIIEEKI